ncbi:hypothetical protein [Halomonas ventosae]|uniref:Histidine phosphatase superfamily protein (Branch 1) n=1 Tax=Halomonas ventosae TaxID=229007 RepID=A0A2T0VR20_9GAMM|nr:hypothetical protein [Halomonas ventosae]PRY72951.1 hypothetical protein BCL64_10230 [Halomonas ventosae]
MGSVHGASRRAGGWWACLVGVLLVAQAMAGTDDEAAAWRALGQTAQARALIEAWSGEGTLVLVTHQVNITALVGGGVGSGEIVVARPSGDGLDVVGRLR